MSRKHYPEDADSGGCGMSRAIDARIAEVLGYAVGYMSDQDAELSIIIDQATESYDVIPHYSTDIECAWGLFETFGRGSTCHKWVERVDGPLTSEWRCEVQLEDGTIKTVADTAPMAICLAALRIHEGVYERCND